MKKFSGRNHRIIESDGKPAFVIVPYSDYVRMMEFLEKSKQPGSRKKSASPAGKSKIPEEVSWRLRKGEPPVRAWRKYRNLTQEELAAQAGLKTSTISLIETGARRGKPETLEAIARVLNVPMKSLRN